MFRSLFLVGLNSRGAYYWREFCVSKWVGLDNKNSVKQSMDFFSGGLVAYYRKDFCVWDLEALFSGGLTFGGAYYQNFTVCVLSGLLDCALFLFLFLFCLCIYIACRWKNKTLQDGYRWTENGVDFFCDSNQRVRPGCYLGAKKITCTGAFTGLLHVTKSSQVFNRQAHTQGH